ncbi:MAG: AAA family ATPase [Nitrososphaeria archaeon]
MFIQDISIKNYRCYKELNLKFRTNKEKNIILITGETEAGKTSLANAIGWCLYGEETQALLKTKTDATKEKFIPNENSYDSSGYARVSVRMTIKIPELPQMDTVVIKREAKFIKGEPNPVYTDLLVEVQDRAGEMRRPPNPNQVLSYILIPKELASFYLFDGEWLKQTEKFDMEINSGFNKLFRIDTFKQIGEVLNEIYSDYSKEAQRAENMSSELKGKYGELTEIEEEIRENNAKLAEIEGELAKFNKEKEQTEEEAKTSKELIELKVKYEKLNFEKNAVEKEASENSKKEATEILQNSYLLNADEIMNDAIKKIEDVEAIKKGDLPPIVKEDFLTGLLNDKMCICGTPLKEGSEQRRRIESLIPNVKEINEKEFLIDLMTKLEYRLKINKEKREEIGKLNDKYKELTQQIDKLEMEINQIISENKDIGKEVVQDPIEKLKWLDEQIRIQEALMSANRERNSELENRRNSVNKDIEKLAGSETEKTKFSKNIDITNTLAEIINAFSKEAVNKFSELLEAEINKLLAANEKLSKFKFERKVISSNEVIFTFKEVGSDLPYFSGGQAQLKGIIMIAAFTRIIEKVAREKLPIPFVVMDHPVSDVDTKRIEKIASELSEMFNNSQVILFVADNKYEVFSELAKEHIANRFLITNDTKNKQSFIEEIKR